MLTTEHDDTVREQTVSGKEVKLMKVKSRVKAGNGGRFDPGG
jgi:hypothetical protein